MNRTDYEPLELEKVRARLASYTAFSASRALALALEPTSDAAEARRRQAATTEARHLLALRPNVTVGGARDVRPLLQRAAVGGVLQPDDLLQVAATARSAAVLRSALLKYEDELPTLAFVARGLGEHRVVLDAIDRSIGDAGEVLDSASAELRQVRVQVRGAYDRLMAKLQELVASPAYRTALQDPIITMREGRYVVPVKVEYRAQVQGLVHDQSASGATVFVEPLAVLDLTNRWRQLQIAEQQEVDRVLAELSGHVSADSQALEWSVEALAELDLHLAMARLADEQHASAPELRECPARTAATDGWEGTRRPVLRLLEARHPLLQGDVVPISVELGSDFDVLLITGPNTGGKTVALKTMGLLSLMALCGLHLPAAEGSIVSVFGGIYADIGDEQSIEQSLSTFSSHVTRIISILDKADARSLVLLDELGAGTDPQEGSALARAILTELRERGSYVVATTHYPELKAYAHLTPRVENASVEFDVESLSPTYRLSVGLPGRSNALAIATRLGMSESVVQAARALLDPTEVEVEHLLGEIQRERAEAGAARAEATRAAEDARKLLERRERQVAAVEQEREAIWRRARQESEAMLAELRRDIQRELAAARAAGSSRAAVGEVAARAAELAPVTAPETRQWSRVRAAAPRAAPTARPLVQVGAAVGVPALQARGTIRSLSADGREAEVDVGGLRVRVKAAELVAPSAIEDGAGGPAGRDAAPVTYVSTAPTLPAAPQAVPLQLDLRGQRAADAVEAVERYLDDAYLAGLQSVRIIHGHGTGAVKKAVRDRLSHHSLVRRWTPAERNQGGDGATEVQLAAEG